MYRTPMILVALAILLAGCRTSPLAPVTSIPKPGAVADTLGNSGSLVKDVEYRVTLTPTSLVFSARYKAALGDYHPFTSPENSHWLAEGTVNGTFFGTWGIYDIDNPSPPMEMAVINESGLTVLPCHVSNTSCRFEVPLSLIGPGPYFYTFGIVETREGPRQYPQPDPIRGVVAPYEEGPPHHIATEDDRRTRPARKPGRS